MLTLFVSSLIFSLLPRPSAAQFSAFPVCVQPLLTQNFPASCLSLSLVAQNTCLCQKANTFGSALVTAINRECGCTDLDRTVQLTEAYCTQVGIDIGPAFQVDVQDNTPCDGSSGSGSGTGTGTGGSGTSMGSGGSTKTVIVSGSSTVADVSTSTSTGGSGSSSGNGSGSGSSTSPSGSATAGSTKNSGGNNRLAIEQVVGIVVVGVTGGILVLQW